MRGLEEPSSAVSLISIDFSKAFNSVNHNVCLNALVRGGASTESLKIVAAFLTRRRMVFKVNNTFSSEIPVNGGARKAHA